MDSGLYPERNGDGTCAARTAARRRHRNQRAADYLAPVTAHYGYNNGPSMTRWLWITHQPHRRLHAGKA